MEEQSAQGLGLIGVFVTLVTWVVAGVLIALGYTLGRFLFAGDKPDLKGTRQRLVEIATWPIRKLDTPQQNNR